MKHLLYISQETAEASHTENIRAACEAGVRWVQLRVKSGDLELREQLAIEAKEICDAYGAKLSINDHPAIAKRVQAFGAHVGLQDIPVRDARGIVGADCWLGGTANTIEDVMQHVAGGADYIGMGPFRFTTTKEKLSPILGLEGYEKIIAALKAQEVHIPVLAIGGILLEDMPALKAAGVYGVAVSGLITHAVDRRAVVEGIRAVWDN